MKPLLSRGPQVPLSRPRYPIGPNGFQIHGSQGLAQAIRAQRVRPAICRRRWLSTSNGRTTGSGHRSRTMPPNPIRP
jgi:hypothetical protein